MKKKLLFLLLSIALVVSLILCTTFKASGLSASISNNSYDVVGCMDEIIHINKFLGTSGGSTFANITDSATESEISSAILRKLFTNGGDAIINMEIDYGASFLDIIGNCFTSSLWAPSTAHVTGAIVKYNNVPIRRQIISKTI